MFWYDYWINGCREILFIGRYGDDGLILFEVREKLLEVRKLVNSGIFFVVEKWKLKNVIKNVDCFEDFVICYIVEVEFVESIRSLRKVIY